MMQGNSAEKLHKKQGPWTYSRIVNTLISIDDLDNTAE